VCVFWLIIYTGINHETINFHTNGQKCAFYWSNNESSLVHLLGLKTDLGAEGLPDSMELGKVLIFGIGQSRLACKDLIMPLTNIFL
jgi:hypothetical protein